MTRLEFDGGRVKKINSKKEKKGGRRIKAIKKGERER